MSDVCEDCGRTMAVKGPSPCDHVFGDGRCAELTIDRPRSELASARAQASELVSQLSGVEMDRRRLIAQNTRLMQEARAQVELTEAERKVVESCLALRVARLSGMDISLRRFLADEELEAIDKLLALRAREKVE